MSKALLVIDDDEASCRLLQATFRPTGIEVSAAHKGKVGIDRAKRFHPDVIALDLRLPDTTGMEVLERLRTAHPDIPVIILTAYGNVKTAVRAMKMGAFDYLTKPIDTDEIVLVVLRALEMRELRDEVDRLRHMLGTDGLAVEMGPSVLVRRVVEQVDVVAASSFSVLIQGEPGTGKDLVAQAVHRRSNRRFMPMLAIDCAAIPEHVLKSELFSAEPPRASGARKKKPGSQLAEGGTLYLDAIGSLPMDLQEKLLRALDPPTSNLASEAPDVRIVASTSENLQTRVVEGRFRADLLWHLAKFTIHLPPLRERVGDVPYLAHRFLAEATMELRRPVQGITARALELLKAHDWPGNAGELRFVVREAVRRTTDVVLDREVVLGLLATSPGTSAGHGATPGKSLKEIADGAAREAERSAIAAALRVTHGNKSRAAKLLRTDYKTLHVKLKHLGLRARDFGA